MGMLTTIKNAITVKSSKAVTKGRGVRSEKFMGNAEVVPNARLSGPPIAPKSKPEGKKVGRYLLGGAAAGGALAYGIADSDDTKGGTQVPTTTSTSSGGSTPTTVPKYLDPNTGSSGAKAPSKPSQSGSGGSGKAMRGSELADYLGLSAGSAVRKNLRAKAGEAVSPKQESPLKPKAQSYRRKMSKG